ncbi:MAG: hypothetical protein KBD24_03500 [Candidatus Pacebacteria bacterium]|nr:hypothetical protein [Candidatus Paceibacterota bacterium]
MEEQNKQSTILMFAILVIIFIASGVSFYRYCYALEYLIYLQVDCDPALTVCTTDGEFYYEKNIVVARDIEKYCSTTQSPSCLTRLREMNRSVETLPCEDNLEDEESCTNPAEYSTSVDTAYDPGVGAGEVIITEEDVAILEDTQDIRSE